MGAVVGYSYYVVAVFDGFFYVIANRSARVSAHIIVRMKIAFYLYVLSRAIEKFL